MVFASSQGQEKKNLLQGITLGTLVYDVEGTVLGTVGRIYQAMDQLDHLLEQVISDLTARTMGADLDTDFKKVGYFVVDAHPYNGSYYISPTQVAEITDIRVLLKCRRSELVFY